MTLVLIALAALAILALGVAAGTSLAVHRLEEDLQAAEVKRAAAVKQAEMDRVADRAVVVQAVARLGALETAITATATKPTTQTEIIPAKAKAITAKERGMRAKGKDTTND